MKLIYAYIKAFLSAALLFSAFLIAITAFSLAMMFFAAWNIFVTFELTLLLVRICISVGLVLAGIFIVSDEGKKYVKESMLQR